MEKKIQSTKEYRISYAMENPSNPEETEWFEKDTFLSALAEYDQHGNVLKTMGYNHAGEINEHYVYKYDDKNNLIEELNYFDEQELAEHRFFKYNEAGKVGEEKVIYMEGGENIITYFYDEQGNLTKRQQTDIDGEIEETEMMDFINGKLVLAIQTDGENSLMSKREYAYNKDGKIINYIFTAADEDGNFRTEYYYDEKGIREKTLKYNAKGQLVEKNLFTTDDQDNVIEIYEEDTRSIKTTRFTYDESNRITRQEEYNRDEDLLMSIERTYNEDGKLAEALVYTQNPAENIRSMSATKYEYFYYDE